MSNFLYSKKYFLDELIFFFWKKIKLTIQSIFFGKGELLYQKVKFFGGA